MESLWYGSRACRKIKCAAERHSRSKRVDRSWKQRCCSQSCLLSQAQRNTSDQDNSLNLDYSLRIRHRCIDMWCWILMLTISFWSRAQSEWIPLRMSTAICWLGEGEQLVPIWTLTICRNTFPPKTTKMFSTRNSSMLMMSSSVYLLFKS